MLVYGNSEFKKCCQKLIRIRTFFEISLIKNDKWYAYCLQNYELFWFDSCINFLETAVVFRPRIFNTEKRF